MREIQNQIEDMFWVFPGVILSSFIWVGLYVSGEAVQRYSWGIFIGGLIVVIGCAMVAGLSCLVILELYFPDMSELGRACMVSATAGVFGAAGKDAFVALKRKIINKIEGL